MHPYTNHLGHLLYVALSFLGLDVPPAAMPLELCALHAWLDTWHGIGLIEHGMARQDRDLSLTRYLDRWGASVFVTGMEHSIVQGSGWQMTPLAPRLELERQLHSHHERIAHARLSARADDVLEIRLDGEPWGDGERVRPFQRHLVGLPR